MILSEEQTRSRLSGETPASSGIDATVPHPARIWNYWLDDKNNYAIDREAGDQHLEVLPDIREIAQPNRTFLARTVEYLSDEAGIDPFLDIGTGLPTADVGELGPGAQESTCPLGDRFDAVFQGLVRLVDIMELADRSHGVLHVGDAVAGSSHRGRDASLANRCQRVALGGADAQCDPGRDS